MGGYGVKARLPHHLGLTNIEVKRMTEFPTHQEIIEIIRDLLEERKPRHEVATWATDILLSSQMKRVEQKSFNVIEKMGAVDEIDIVKPFRYNAEDFKEWISILES